MTKRILTAILALFFSTLPKLATASIALAGGSSGTATTASTSGWGGSSSFNISLGSGVNSTNCPTTKSCVVILIITDGGSDSTVSNYTKIDRYGGFGNLESLYHLWSPGDPVSSISVTNSGTVLAWGTLAYSGTNTTTSVIDAFGGHNAGGGTSCATGTLTTTVANDMILSIFNSSGAATFGSFSPGTQEVQGGDFSSNFINTIMDIAQAGIGTTTSGTATLTSGIQCDGMQIALAPFTPSLGASLSGPAILKAPTQLQ